MKTAKQNIKIHPQGKFGRLKKKRKMANRTGKK